MKKSNSTKNIRIAFFLNLGFTILEFIGGYLTNSMAIFSNALHDLGDNFSLGLSWFLDRFSKKEKSDKFSYGYRRFSLLAALVNTMILIIGSVIILSEAIPRILNPEQTMAQGMIAFAALGIVVNGIAVLRLRSGQSMNEQVVTWHLLEDVLGWTVVFVVGLILLIKDIYVLDPILSVLIAAYVLYNVIKNLLKTSALFLQGVPDKITLREIEQILESFDKVHSTHHTHIWSLDGEHHVLTTHVVIDPNAKKEDVILLKVQILKAIEKLNFEHTTIEIEYQDEDCRQRPEKFEQILVKHQASKTKT